MSIVLVAAYLSVFFALMACASVVQAIANLNRAGQKSTETPQPPPQKMDSDRERLERLYRASAQPDGWKDDHWIDHGPPDMTGNSAEGKP